MMRITRKEVCDAVAKSLREFGYRDVNDKMIDEILTAWIDGKRNEELPFGIVGRMASGQFEEFDEASPNKLATLK